MILFWFYFSGLLDRIIRRKYLVTGDWSQSNCCPCKGGYSDADHLCCNSSTVVTRYMTANFSLFSCDASIVVIFFNGCPFFGFLSIVLMTGAAARFPESITKTRLFKYIENFTTKN